MTADGKKALVLSGGGVAGIAWELGVLHGISAADPDLGGRVLAADVVVGTSAGSSVAAQITAGVPLDDLYAAQLSPETAEISVDIDLTELAAVMQAITGDAADGREAIRRLGAMAMTASPAEPDARLAAVRARLPREDWPDRDVRITGIDAESGDRRVFGPDSGVSLLAAVTASCAVPGVWPPVAIGDRWYIDGGTVSMTNADLAAPAEAVLILRPLMPFDGSTGLPEREVAALGEARTLLVGADQASLEAFGTNPLSPATRGASARAGHAVGRRVAGDVAAIWR